MLSPGLGEQVCPVYTISLHESRLYDFCKEHSISCYLPLKKTFRTVSQTHNGKRYRYLREVLRPMFPSYIFAKLNGDQRALLFRSESVVRIIGVDDQEHLLEELQTVRKLEQLGLTQELEFNSSIKEGDKFFIESGPLQGTYGWLKKKGKHFTWSVEIECVGTIVKATIDPTVCTMTKAE